jgi:hypothetical protein
MSELNILNLAQARFVNNSICVMSVGTSTSLLDRFEFVSQLLAYMYEVWILSKIRWVASLCILKVMFLYLGYHLLRMYQISKYRQNTKILKVSNLMRFL